MDDGLKNSLKHLYDTGFQRGYCKAKWASRRALVAVFCLGVAVGGFAAMLGGVL
jgi:hypothetical protein